MQPDPANLIGKLGLATPLLGFYVAPDPSPFEPLTAPGGGKQQCVFSFYENWLKGETLHLTRENFGCRGAGMHWFGLRHRSREEFVKFLVDFEGLKSSHEKMNLWLDCRMAWKPEHPDILVGPLKPGQYEYLKTIAFLVSPDQLSALMIGAEYDGVPGDPPPVIAPFGSGCMQMVPLFEDLAAAQGAIGATDIAMRRFLPPDVLMFIVTKPMFERLCGLDDKCFLHKPFWKGLQRARKKAQNAVG